MNRFFEMRLRSGAIALPMLLTMVAVCGWMAARVALRIPFPLLGSDIQTDWHFVCLLLEAAVLRTALAFAVWPLIYLTVTRLISSVYLDSQPFSCETSLREFMSATWIWLLVTALSFGIALPWLLTRARRFIVSHILHDYTTMEFSGEPMTLFCILAPLAVAWAAWMRLAEVCPPQNIGNDITLVWTVLAVAAFVVVNVLSDVAIILFWNMRLWYGAGRICSMTSMGRLFRCFLGQDVLSLLTLGIYAPAACVRKYAMVVDSSVWGDSVIRAELSYETPSRVRDWLYVLLQTLLSAVTLGIYLPWAVVRVLRRLVSRTSVYTPDRPREPMPDIARPEEA